MSFTSKNIIAHKFIMYVIIFATFLTIIVTLFKIQTEYTIYQKEIHNDFKRIEESYIPSVQDSFWNINRNSLKLLLSGILNMNSIVYTEIIDNNNTSFFHIGTIPQKNNAIVRTYDLTYRTSVKTHKLGTLTVYAYKKSILQFFKETSARVVAEEFLRIFFIAVFIFFLVYSMFVRNINAMVKYFSVLNFDNMDKPLSIPKKRSAQLDEIDQLQISINQIVDKLRYDHTELQEKAKERKQLLNQIASKNEELETIIYVTSHDLRSPLVNIQGFSNELIESFNGLRNFFQKQDNFEHEDKEEALEIIRKHLEDFNDTNITSIEFIQASSGKMDHFLNGLLEISRLGRAEPKIEKLDMNTIMENIIKSMQYEIMSNEVEVNVESLPECIGDAGQVNQIFTNLIENAIKYSKDHEHCVINITAKIKEQTSVYCVQDNGIGIPKNALNRIFKIFYRTNTNKSEGEGLGLTIVKKTIEKNNGSIHIESQEHIGSKFFVSLPIS